VPSFQTPDLVLTGLGCFEKVGQQTARFGRMCLLVTGETSMQQAGAFDKAIHLLYEAGVKTVACTGVEHDPSLETVDTARDALTRNACDVVLGLGGGSALDVAKAAAGLAREEEPTRAFFDGRPLSGTGLPVLAAPSTFGTGSEATRVSVLSDPSRRLKKSIRHDCMLPKVAMVDPVLGASAPPRVTAACGMDALTQAIESYLSKHATDLTRALSFSSVVLLMAGLPRAHADGHDMEARESCANGALLAGMALHNARLGLVHGLAHPLGIRYDIPHGEVCGVLLPHVLAYNRAAVPQDYDLLSGILGEDAATVCWRLLEQLGLPADLAHLEIPASDVPLLAKETLPSGSTQSNPRTVTETDVEDLLRTLTSGP
jgi:alcohol dehydrogenase class IV